MRLFGTFFLVLFSFCCADAGLAQSMRNNVIYGGAGASIGEAAPNNKSQTPFSIGYLRTSETRSIVWGFDAGLEGVKLDSTWQQTNAVKQGVSINVLLGAKLAGNDTVRLDVAALAGARQVTASCPRSYLGYQCYANSAPNVGYGFNYGAVAALSFRRVMVGARVTGESAQGLIGFRF